MKRVSVKFQILLFSMIPVLIIDIFLTALNVNKSLEQAQRQLQSKGDITAKQIASAVEFYLFAGDNQQIRRLLVQSVADPDIVYASVYNQQGTLLAEAHSDKYSAAYSDRYSYSREPIMTQPIESGDVFDPASNQADRSLLGWVHLYVARDQLEQNREQIILEGIIVFAVMLVVAFVLAAIISQRITRPVFSLLDHLKGVEKGDLGRVITHIAANEIGDVQRGFNSMSQALLANRNELNQRIEQATEDLRDAVSDLEDKNRELGLARDSAQEANRIKSQFLANISHEIRTPINGIQGFINLVRQTGLKRNQKRYIDIMQQSVNDLGAMITELLDFSKLESGKVTILDSEFDLFNLLESTRDGLFTATMEKDIDLHLAVFSDTPQMVIGDSLRLKQILRNLIGNAIKFTDNGYVSITVYLLDENDTEATLLFRIEDSGIGISQTQQKQLFRAFAQLESDPNRRHAGTGLGLVISRNLARLMGGDITLESSPGIGSIFTVQLPFRLAPQPAAGNSPFHAQTAFVMAFNRRCLTEVQSAMNRIGFITETQLLESRDTLDIYRSQIRQNLAYLNLIVFDLRHGFVAPDALLDGLSLGDTRVIIMHYDAVMVEPELLAQYDFVSVINTGENIAQALSWQDAEETTQETLAITPAPSARLLVVDDNSMNLTLAAELARLWGHEADMAKNAGEAMLLFGANDYDLILLDLQMPEIDGIELMQMMRREKPELQAPIVSLTANAVERQEAQRLLELGFNACLQKPLDEAKLQRLLDGASGEPPPTAADWMEQSTGAMDDSSLAIEHSVQLAGNSRQITRNMLNMLQQSLPEFRQQLQGGLESRSLGKLAWVNHKLQGVTAYAGLPRLKRLLNEYHEKKLGESNEIFAVVERIITELDNIETSLDSLADTDL